MLSVKVDGNVKGEEKNKAIEIDVENEKLKKWNKELEIEPREQVRSCSFEYSS